MKKKSCRLTKAILETASDMLNCEILSKEDYEKITMRHLKKEQLTKIPTMTSKEIKALREKAHLSQAAFARYLNLTPGYISKLERGEKEPSGAVLLLLNVIQRKGLDVIR